MPISKEAIETIINYCPVKGIAKGEQVIDLGTIDGMRLVYGRFEYQQRVMSLPGEPFIPSWTRQPVLALESRQNDQVTRTILAYSTDVSALGEDLVAEVVGRLNIARAR